MHVDAGGGQPGPGGDVPGRRRVEPLVGEGAGRGLEQPGGRRRRSVGPRGSSGRGCAVALVTLTACPTLARLSKRLVTGRGSLEDACPATSTTTTTRPSGQRPGVRRPHASPADRGDARAQGDPARHLEGGRQAGPARPRHPRGVRRRGGGRLPLQRRRGRGDRQLQRGRLLVLRHPRRRLPALPRRPRHRGAEAALAAGHGVRRADLRDRDDRAVRRLRPRRPARPRPSATATTGSSTAPRPSSPTATRPTWSSSPPAPTRARAPRASPCSWSRPAWRASPAAASSTRSARRSPTPPSCSSTTSGSPTPTGSARRAMGFIAMMQRLPQERIGVAVANTCARRADPHRDDRVHQGAQGVRPADRLLPAQQVQDRRAGHQDRGHPGLRRRLRRRPRPGSSPRSTRPRPSGGQRRCRTTSSTTASSSTAATAS